MDGISNYVRNDSIAVPIPEKIGEMFDIAEKLSKGIPFVRVDFYYVNKKILLSELTFAPGGGVLPYSQAFNERWGAMLHLPFEQQNKDNMNKQMTTTTQIWGGGIVGKCVITPSMLTYRMAA